MFSCFLTIRELNPTLLLERDGLIKSCDLVFIFCQNIVIYRFNYNKSLSCLAEPSLCERERLSQGDAFGRVSSIYFGQI